MTLNGGPLMAAAARAADVGLAGLERHAEAPAPRRPTWQRGVLPILGTLLVLTGILLFWLPFTNLLLVIGLPLMCCFSRGYENAARSRMRPVLAVMRRWIPRRTPQKRRRP